MRVGRGGQPLGGQIDVVQPNAISASIKGRGGEQHSKRPSRASQKGKANCGRLHPNGCQLPG